MKYGGQGGWRAIKRFNRDARIADGSSPYGYRTRYSGRGRSSQTTAGSVDTSLTGNEIGCLAAFALVVIGIVVAIAVGFFNQVGPLGFVGVAIGGSLLLLFLQYRKKPPAGTNPADSLAASPSIQPPMDRRCTATTKKGLRCKRAAVLDGRCTLHVPKRPGLTDAPLASGRPTTIGDLFSGTEKQLTEAQPGLTSSPRMAIEGDIFLRPIVESEDEK